MTALYCIKISQYFESPPETELFSILEQLLPVKFILGEQREIQAQGMVVNGEGANKDAANIPSLSLPSDAGSVNKSKHVEAEVEFADDPDVPFPFRGRKVSTKLAQVGVVLSVQNNEKILATCKQGAIWSILEINGVRHFRSVLSLPHISFAQNFNDVFNGEYFLEMLVLLQFIREITTKTAYQNAPLRAGFIIDDPNLHWPRYGYVDYREIVAHAQKENYHVAFATIPFDTWYTHTATANLFRQNSQWLSLLIHGNNHAKEELALNYSDEMRKALLVQAIKRIECLEKKASLDVCRVMVPPHGACSNEMLAELPKCGFDSACISAGSLRFHNQDKPWVKTLGFFPSEIIKGCPVLPRWGLTGKVQNTLLVAAYLGQPLILRGHHQDLKDGEVDEYAKFINGLGTVLWSNMTGLNRLNYLWRTEGTTCRVKPLGRKAIFRLPTEATEVIIENPTVVDDDIWRAVFADGQVYNIMQDERFPLTESMSREISIERNDLTQPLSLTTNFKPTPMKLILRRLLTETRDRLLWD